MNTKEIKGLVNTCRVFDLGMEYYTGMPHHPNHPPFAFSLTKVHGDMVYAQGVSAANCLFTTGGHTGTHMDAHGHISVNNQVYGVGDIEPWQDYQGLQKAGIHEAAPVFTRGVLFDVAGLEGVECLAPDYRVTAEALKACAERQGTTLGPGEAALIRTGWIQHFQNARKYISHHEGCPGLVEDGAEWLVEKGIGYAGADTVALEKTPSANLPVHVILLVTNGIYIIEAMNLEELAKEGIYEFLFIVSPLKIRGGTASPVRPLAIV